MVSNGLDEAAGTWGEESCCASALDSAESVDRGIGITLPFQLIVSVTPSDLIKEA
jgi:hypothetical protein